MPLSVRVLVPKHPDYDGLVAVNPVPQPVRSVSHRVQELVRLRPFSPAYGQKQERPRTTNAQEPEREQESVILCAIRQVDAEHVKRRDQVMARYVSPNQRFVRLVAVHDREPSVHPVEIPQVRVKHRHAENTVRRGGCPWAQQGV